MDALAELDDAPGVLATRIPDKLLGVIPRAEVSEGKTQSVLLILHTLQRLLSELDEAALEQTLDKYGRRSVGTYWGACVYEEHVVSGPRRDAIVVTVREIKDPKELREMEVGKQGWTARLSARAQRRYQGSLDARWSADGVSPSGTWWMARPGADCGVSVQRYLA